MYEIAETSLLAVARSTLPSEAHSHPKRFIIAGVRRAASRPRRQPRAPAAAAATSPRTAAAARNLYYIYLARAKFAHQTARTFISGPQGGRAADLPRQRRLNYVDFIRLHATTPSEGLTRSRAAASYFYFDLLDLLSARLSSRWINVIALFKQAIS